MTGPLIKNQRADSPYLYRLDSLLSNQGNFGTPKNHLDSAVGSLERLKPQVLINYSEKITFDEARETQNYYQMPRISRV